MVIIAMPLRRSLDDDGRGGGHRLGRLRRSLMRSADTLMILARIRSSDCPFAFMAWIASAIAPGGGDVPRAVSACVTSALNVLGSSRASRFSSETTGSSSAVVIGSYLPQRPDTTRYRT